MINALYFGLGCHQDFIRCEKTGELQDCLGRGSLTHFENPCRSAIYLLVPGENFVIERSARQPGCPCRKLDSTVVVQSAYPHI